MDERVELWTNNSGDTYVVVVDGKRVTVRVKNLRELLREAGYREGRK